MGGNFKCQFKDSFMEIFVLEIGRFEKRIVLSEKKSTLAPRVINIYCIL